MRQNINSVFKAPFELSLAFSAKISSPTLLKGATLKHILMNFLSRDDACRNSVNVLEGGGKVWCADSVGAS